MEPAELTERRAVEGLAPAEFFAAYSACRDLLPQGMEKDYLDFRRFFRHAYGYRLEWSQLRWKAESLSATLTMLRDQLRLFFERRIA